MGAQIAHFYPPGQASYLHRCIRQGWLMSIPKFLFWPYNVSILLLAACKRLAQWHNLMILSLTAIKRDNLIIQPQSSFMVSWKNTMYDLFHCALKTFPLSRHRVRKIIDKIKNPVTAFIKWSFQFRQSFNSGKNMKKVSTDNATNCECCKQDIQIIYL